MGGSARDGIRAREIKYSALPSQQLFHRSAARFKGFSGPVGSGKSQALCQEAVRLSYLNPGRLGLMGAPTYPMLRDATQTAFFEILNANQIPYDFNKSENLVKMLDTKSKILFRQVDEFERLRGTNLAWFGLDELTYSQEAAWLRLEARLRDPKANRLCGFAVWTPKGFDWVYQRFISDPKPGYEAIIAKPFENRHLLTQVPDFYERLRSSYDANFFEQEVMGQYLNMQGGLVYSAFDRKENVTATTMDVKLPLLWGIDFNVDPMCSLVAQHWQGTFWVLDEIVLRHATTEEACRCFCERYGQHKGEVVIYADASGNSRRTSGASDLNILRGYLGGRKVRFDDRTPDRNPAVRDRIGMVNGKLKSAAGDVRLLVDPKCKELIKDFEQVGYKEDSNEVDKGKDRKRTHMSDALGYILWGETAAQGGQVRFGEQSRPLV